MLRSRSNTSGYTTYFWKKPWKTGLFAWGAEKVYPWACMGCGVVLFYLDRLPSVAEEYRPALFAVRYSSATDGRRSR